MAEKSTFLELNSFNERIEKKTRDIRGLQEPATPQIYRPYNYGGRHVQSLL